MDSIDPGALLGLSIGCILLVCAVLIYRVRDPTPTPQVIVRRLRCPHSQRKCTVEFGTTAGNPVVYCSAFAFDELACDQACRATLRLHSPPVSASD